MAAVRYYGQTYDPSTFRKAGLRGRFILVLAWMHDRIGRWIEWHVMHFVAKREGFPREQVLRLERAFKIENEQQRRQQMEEASPERRDIRHIARKNSPEATYRQTRAMRSEQFFARYMDTGRAGGYRYARGQRLANPDGDVEPVVEQEKR